MAEAIEQWTGMSEEEWLIVLTRSLPSWPCLSPTGSEPQDLTAPNRAYLSIEVQREFLFLRHVFWGTNSNHSKVQLFWVCWSRCLLFNKCCPVSRSPLPLTVSVSCLSFIHVPSRPLGTPLYISLDAADNIPLFDNPQNVYLFFVLPI